jgi:glycine cleavage system transcriptional repressor
MKKYMILSLVGKDRPGIVDEVSGFLLAHGGNIEDSRMAAMGGRFSIMTLFSCPEGRIEGIKKDMPELTKLGFEVSLHEAEDPNTVPRHPELPLKMEVISMDHPGIVQRVVSILHRHNVNIQTLETKTSSAPLSGAPLFDLVLSAAVPAEESIVKVKEELLALAAEMNLDLSFLK